MEVSGVLEVSTLLQQELEEEAGKKNSSHLKTKKQTQIAFFF